jgi:hypothetical protein
MKRRVSSAATPRTANGQGGKKRFVSRRADLSGAKIHYTIGGSGPAVSWRQKRITYSTRTRNGDRRSSFLE